MAERWLRIYDGLTDREVVLLHRWTEVAGTDALDIDAARAMRRSWRFAWRLHRYRAGALLADWGAAMQRGAQP